MHCVSSRRVCPDGDSSPGRAIGGTEWTVRMENGCTECPGGMCDCVCTQPIVPGSRAKTIREPSNALHPLCSPTCPLQRETKVHTQVRSPQVHLFHSALPPLPTTAMLISPRRFLSTLVGRASVSEQCHRPSSSGDRLPAVATRHRLVYCAAPFIPPLAITTPTTQIATVALVGLMEASLPPLPV